MRAPPGDGGATGSNEAGATRGAAASSTSIAVGSCGTPAAHCLGAGELAPFFLGIPATVSRIAGGDCGDIASAGPTPLVGSPSFKYVPS